MDIKKAYDVLNVPENASQEEVEKKYELWIRENKTRQRKGKDNSEQLDMQTINEAYETIRAHFSSGEEPRAKKSRLAHPFWKKIDHLFYYYKVHILIGLIILIASVYFFQSIMGNDYKEASHTSTDVSIVFFGEYPELDVGAFKKRVLSTFPSWNGVTVKYSYVPDKTETAHDAALRKKSAIRLMKNEYDIYIMNSKNFKKLKGLYQALSQIEDDLKGKLDPDQLVYAKADNNSKKHLYGVEITNSDFFKVGTGSLSQKIVTVRKDAKHLNNALKLIKQFVKSSP